MIAQAFAAVQRNYRALLLYLLIHVTVSSAIVAFNTLVVEVHKEDLGDQWVSYIALFGNILDAVAWALAQAICFARIGRDMDRPLWKIESDGEAVKRFFGMWLLLDLLNLTMVTLATTLYKSTDYQDTAVAIAQFHPMLAACIVPIGAAIMFYGHAGRVEIGKSLNTFFAQFPRSLAIWAMGFFAFIILSSLLIEGQLGRAFYPLIAAVDSYFDCFIFACVWLTCLKQRTDEEEHSDFEF